jgi:hypothetical protein
VLLQFSKEDFIYVSITVDVDEHPRFKTIKAGTPIWVEGAIVGISNRVVDLTDCSLSFE